MIKDPGAVFPVGYYKFHKDQAYNFQLNRWHSLGLTKYKEIKEAARMIKNFTDWKNEMLKLAKKAEEEERLLNAAFYYRSAEFYTMAGETPGKEYFYDKFADLFYRAIEPGSLTRVFIPYHDSAEIPVIITAAEGQKKGTILLHGGFDSFIEEWYLVMKYLSASGFDVIGFEGPGQGHMLIKQGIPLDYRWERPVKCLLDHFALNDVTLFGLSMGGWFGLRAAAYEIRIKNVVASGHAVDYSRIPPAFARWLMMFFIRYFRSYTSKSFYGVIKKGGIQGWQTSNLAHITHMEPLEAFEYSLNLNQENLSCERITQNVLYLTGRNDHFVPFKMHEMQIKLFTRAKSLTDRVYYPNEQASNHCQVGNIKLMLDDVIDWINTRS